MQTKKLYDGDAYKREFDARVLSCTQSALPDGTPAYDVMLDGTLFFPEEGGQTPDRGTLRALPAGEGEASGDVPKEAACAPAKEGGDCGMLPADDAARVLDVQIREGVIRHVTDRPFREGTAVHGTLDWAHRFDNMQQHTGEHIFSGLVYAAYGYDNVGFHLSENVVTMDYSGVLSAEEAARIETEANEAIVRNLEVRASFPPKETLADMTYRSKKEIEGQVRIVTIPGVDVCACCAPHVRRTGEVGQLKVLALQHYKGGVRVTIACGMRALEQFRTAHALLTKTAQHLTTSPANVFDSVLRLQEERSQLREQLSLAKFSLARLRADQFPSGQRHAFLFLEEAERTDANGMRRIVNLLTERHEGFCGVFSEADDAVQFVAGSAGLDCRIFLEELKKSFPAKGGGSPKMVQGRIDRTPRMAVEAFLREYPER